MLLLYFIIQVFHKNYNVLLIGGSLDRFLHDALVKLYQICLSFYKAALVKLVGLARRSFCKSGGSGGQFAGLMDALHPLPRCLDFSMLLIQLNQAVSHQSLYLCV